MLINKPTICIDFHGVLHSYKSKWSGEVEMDDPPNPEAILFLEEAVKHFIVYVCSRGATIDEMKEWVEEWAMELADDDSDLGFIDEILFTNKPPKVVVTLDDRAMKFTGTFPSMRELLEFKTWDGR